MAAGSYWLIYTRSVAGVTLHGVASLLRRSPVNILAVLALFHFKTSETKGTHKHLAFQDLGLAGRQMTMSNEPLIKVIKMPLPLSQLPSKANQCFHTWLSDKVTDPPPKTPGLLFD